MLILDAASRRVWVGLKQASDRLDFLAEDGDSTRLLFAFARALLGRNSLALSDVASIACNEGPGSMLGIRTAAMAIRAWAGIGAPAAGQLFAYNSLALCAALLAREPGAPSEFAVAIDARRDSWNLLTLGPDAASRIALAENAVLEAERCPIYVPDAFPRWTATSAPLRPLAYRPETQFADDSFARILRPVDQATPLALRASDFKKWTPQIHGSATA